MQLLEEILKNAPLFLLVFGRIFAFLMSLPLFSARNVPSQAKIALALYFSYFIFTQVDFSHFLPYLTEDGVFSMQYLLLLIGEFLIGIINGFYVTIIFAAFSTAGQFVAFQMGFSAASSYDSLSQVENPLMGQFFNLIAMLVFMQTHWFQKLFLQGLVTSFSSLNAISIVQSTESIVKFVLSGLSSLFVDALVISLPVMGSLFLISICTGLLTKAAPQMNLLSEGFPIMIMLAFVIIAFILPDMIDFFVRSFEKGFADLFDFFKNVSGGV